jgi:hypothetical protein
MPSSPEYNHKENKNSNHILNTHHGAIHCAKAFTGDVLFHPHKNLVILSAILHAKKFIEKFVEFSKAPQLENGAFGT